MERIKNSDIVSATSDYANATPSSENPDNGNQIMTSRKNKMSNPLHAFKNLIACGAVNNTNDSAQRMMIKQKKAFMMKNTCSSDLCRWEKPKFSCNWPQRAGAGGDEEKGSSANKNGELREKRAVDHKQVKWPKCSQCKKAFNPEKLVAHMNSCCSACRDFK